MREFDAVTGVPLATEPARLKVLIAEDDELLRWIAEEVVEQLGLGVVSFECADEAITYMRANPDEVSMVVTDYIMPGELDGWEFAKQVCRKWPEVPVILTTGSAGESEGNIRFLQKPWQIGELTDLIRSAVAAIQRRQQR
ncbi:response regulator [Pseudomonas japonica]|uniref:response regulator n=1 Tax=Pseudomonas japonica TaxID=256466 RepID=UPI0015E42F55|nr:response regulator [Pseudomonas japonica]MBA1242293.1 response regulator [Pseudomonas japonica]